MYVIKYKANKGIVVVVVVIPRLWLMLYLSCKTIKKNLGLES